MHQDTTATSITVSPSLPNGDRFYWSVYAYDATGELIAYYNAWGFTVIIQ